MHNPRTISVDELVHDQACGRVPELWNVLTDDYFTGEMIPGSRRVPLDRVGREAIQSGLTKDAPIVVHCSGPSCPQSKAASEKLAALGFTNVRVFEGGLDDWKRSGRAVNHVNQTATR